MTDTIDNDDSLETCPYCGVVRTGEGSCRGCEAVERVQTQGANAGRAARAYVRRMVLWGSIILGLIIVQWVARSSESELLVRTMQIAGIGAWILIAWIVISSARRKKAKSAALLASAEEAEPVEASGDHSCPLCGRVTETAVKACSACASGVEARFAASLKAIKLKNRGGYCLGLGVLMLVTGVIGRFQGPLAAVEAGAGSLLLLGAGYLLCKSRALQRAAATPVGPSPRDVVAENAGSAGDTVVPVGYPPPDVKTLNFLLLSDTHGGAGPIESLGAHARGCRLDAVLLAGDFTNFGQYGAPLFDTIRGMGLHCAFVSGNSERREMCESVAEKYGFAYADYAVTQVLGVNVVGVAACDMFSGAREKRIDEFARTLDADEIESPKLLLTHEPPSPWMRRGRDLGSGPISRLMRRLKPDLVVTGHIHETGPFLGEGLAGIPVINPGPTGCLVCVDLEAGTITPA